MYVEHLRIDVGPGAVHAERLGRGGAPVVLVHGFGTCAALWRDFLPRLAMRGHTALAVDLLGAGESDRPADAALDLAAQGDVLDRVLGALGMPPAVLVGQDVGAFAAVHAAARDAGRTSPRVASVVLVNPPDPAELPDGPTRALQRGAARLALGSGAGRLSAGALLGPLLREGVREDARVTEPAFARLLAPYADVDGVEQLLRLASAIESGTGAIPFAEVRVPALVLRGDRDGTVTGTVARTIAAQLPRGAFRMLEQTGRLAVLDAPDTLDEALSAWLVRFVDGYDPASAEYGREHAQDAATVAAPDPALENRLPGG